MKRRYDHNIPIACFLISWVVGMSGATAEPKKSFERDLDARIASTLPTVDEDRWLTIPWRSNLMKARLEAQILNRPMFLWIMNGNPMGCT
jgi:hypothetical protein